jgi:hypothetical protein
MNQPILRPSPALSEVCVATANPAERTSAYPQPKRMPRPGWKPTLVREQTFAKLRAIQKSTTDPAIDLSYLTDACLQIALEMGGEAIVRRALDDMSARTNP